MRRIAVGLVVLLGLFLSLQTAQATDLKIKFSVEVPGENGEFLQSRTRALETVLGTTLTESLEGARGEILVRFYAEGNTLGIAVSEERSKPDWLGLGIETDPRGRHLNCRRAYLMASSISSWIFRTFRDAYTERGQLFASALSNALITTSFKRSDNGRTLTISGERTDYSRQGVWARITSPLLISRPRGKTVTVYPAAGKVGVYRFYLDPDEALDGTRSSAAAVREFLK